MEPKHTTTPGYDSGWYNGNPRLQIEAGTYDRYRDRLKGFTPDQIKEFDALNEQVQAERKNVGNLDDVFAQKQKNYEEAMKARREAAAPKEQLRRAKNLEKTLDRREAELDSREAAVAKKEEALDTPVGAAPVAKKPRKKASKKKS